MPVCGSRGYEIPLPIFPKLGANDGVDHPTCKIWLQSVAGGDVSAGTLNLREWKMQEWTMRHHVARVDSAGMDNAGVVKCV